MSMTHETNLHFQTYKFLLIIFLLKEIPLNSEFWEIMQKSGLFSETDCLIDLVNQYFTIDKIQFLTSSKSEKNKN